MNRLKFSIKTLLALSTLVAIAVVATRPFAPHIHFEATPTSFCDAQNHNIFAGYDMSLTNKGSFPIWIAASSETNPVYIHASGYEEKGSMSAAMLADNIVAVGKKVHWIRLARNEPFAIHFPLAMKRPHLLGILVKDWRGREAEAWSRSYIPPHF